MVLAFLADNMKLKSRLHMGSLCAYAFTMLDLLLYEHISTVCNVTYLECLKFNSTFLVAKINVEKI